MFQPRADHAPFVFAFYLRKTPKAKPELTHLMTGGFGNALVLQVELAKELKVKTRQIEMACYFPKPPDGAIPKLLAVLTAARYFISSVECEEGLSTDGLVAEIDAAIGSAEVTS